MKARSVSYFTFVSLAWQSWRTHEWGNLPSLAPSGTTLASGSLPSSKSGSVGRPAVDRIALQEGDRVHPRRCLSQVIMGTEEEMGHLPRWQPPFRYYRNFSSQPLFIFRRRASCAESTLEFPMAPQGDCFLFISRGCFRQYQTCGSCSLLSAHRLGACWHTVGVEWAKECVSSVTLTDCWARPQRRE